MRLRSWVKWFLFELVAIDVMLITLCLYMIRIIEIGG